VHQQLEEAYKGDDDVVFIYAQTVFEGFERNSFELGLKDLDKLGIKSPYAFDPGDPKTGKRSSIMTGYLTGGTPWTIVIDAKGIVRYSAFTGERAAIGRVIDAGKPQKKTDEPGD
jgi:hypothetical protein